jgi:predicted membrane channel-forming protein YqfA (hemolysin III family)
MEDKELDNALENVVKLVKQSNEKSGAMAVPWGTALLGIAVRKLDQTSKRLAWVNIGLTVALAIIGMVQVCLMLHGH